MSRARATAYLSGLIEFCDKAKESAMSSWFDAWDREVNAIGDVEGEDFLNKVADIDERHCDIVLLALDDREVPSPVREQGFDIIQKFAMYNRISEEVKTDAVIGRTSEVSRRLHSLFHRVASMRVQTRFGRLDDSPCGWLLRRDEADDTSVLCDACRAALNPCACSDSA
jgi:hypothetical protein